MPGIYEISIGTKRICDQSKGEAESKISLYLLFRGFFFLAAAFATHCRGGELGH